MIESAAVELADGRGDGAYDLLDATGTPEEIGRRVGESLAGCDLSTGPSSAALADRGEAVYLVLRIKVERSPDRAYLPVMPDGTPYSTAYRNRSEAEAQAANIAKDLEEADDPIDLVPVHEIEVH